MVADERKKDEKLGSSEKSIDPSLENKHKKEELSSTDDTSELVDDAKSKKDEMVDAEQNDAVNEDDNTLDEKQGVGLQATLNTLVDDSDESEAEDDRLLPANKSKNSSANARKNVQRSMTALSFLQSLFTTAFYLNLLMFMKQMLLMLLQITMAGVTALISGVMAVISAITQFVVGIFGTVTAIIVAILGIIGIFVTGAWLFQALMIPSIPYDPCDSALSNNADNLPVVDENAQELAYAKAMYSVFASYEVDGERVLSDVQIAGMLGNFTVESGIDPTTIETIYDEPYSVDGPRKSDAVSDLNSFVEDEVFSAYDGTGITLNHEAYRASDGLLYPGIGVGQWTGGRAQLLVDFADSNGLAWFSIETQLAFMLSEDTRASYFTSWSDETNASDAAMTFAKGWIGNTSVHQQERRDSAIEWSLQIETWDINSDYASSVLGMVGSSQSGTHGNSMTGNDECNVPTGDNTSIASAAASLAYPTVAESRDNDGTELYQRIYSLVLSTDGFGTQSCDRGASTAIRWSGADDNFPAGSTSEQLTHLLTSSKWEQVAFDSKDDLQPGDVLIRTNGPVRHIVIYIGPEIASQVHGDSLQTGAEIAHASISGRSMGMDAFLMPGDVVVDGVDHTYMDYTAFRNVQAESNSIYKNIDSVNNE